MTEHVANRITPPMMRNAEKNIASLRKILSLVGLTGNEKAEAEVGEAKPEKGEWDPTQGQIQQAIQSLVHLAQNFGGVRLIGNAPGGLAEVIRAVIEPPPPWHQRLRMRLAANGGQNGSPDLMPDENYLYLLTGYKVWTPSFNMPRLGSLLFLMDTSGSIPDAMMQKAINQILASVLNKEVGRVILQCWDTEVYPAFEAEGAAAVRQAMMEVRINGRGGTDLRPVFESAGGVIRKKDIQQVVTITDGCACYPEKSPDWLDRVPMLFLTTAEKPPWTHPNMTVLVMEDMVPDRVKA
jgi:predicted metal-dependent peptidase